MLPALVSASAMGYLLIISLNSCDRQQVPETAAPALAAAGNTYYATAIADYELEEQALVAGGWRKTWEENFEGSLDKWNVWTGGAYNNELQHYRAANLSIRNGMLGIEVKKESVSGNTLPGDATPKQFAYTSGRIESKTLFSASPKQPVLRMAARIKLPAGYGLWPAFWSYGDPWPTQGEIDILEARGQEADRYQTAYWYGRRAGVNNASNTEGYIRTNGNLTTSFHVYEVVWEKNSLQFWLDGQLVETKTGGYIPSFFNKKQKITLNVAVGGGFFQGLDPSRVEGGEMVVDWVKVFTR